MAGLLRVFVEARRHGVADADLTVSPFRAARMPVPTPMRA